MLQVVPDLPQGDVIFAEPQPGEPPPLPPVANIPPVASAPPTAALEPPVASMPPVAADPPAEAVAPPLLEELPPAPPTLLEPPPPRGDELSVPLQPRNANATAAIGNADLWNIVEGLSESLNGECTNAIARAVRSTLVVRVARGEEADLSPRREPNLATELDSTTHFAALTNGTRK